MGYTNQIFLNEAKRKCRRLAICGLENTKQMRQPFRLHSKISVTNLPHTENRTFKYLSKSLLFQYVLPRANFDNSSLTGKKIMNSHKPFK